MKNKKQQKVIASLFKVCVSSTMLPILLASQAWATDYKIVRSSPQDLRTNASMVTFNIVFTPEDATVSQLNKEDIYFIKKEGAVEVVSVVYDPSDNSYLVNVSTTESGSVTIDMNKNYTVANNLESGDFLSYYIDKIPPPSPDITSEKITFNQQPILSGQGESGSVLAIKLADGTTVCSTIIDKIGNWQCSLANTLPYDLYELSITAEDDLGNVSPAIQSPLRIMNPQGDDDGDGLSNADEANITGTDPLKADTDGDGVNDFIEVGDKNNPTDSNNDGTIDALDPMDDADGDGIGTLLETTLGTNPRNPDSDGDGINDNLEIGATGTDTDNDGIDDRYDVDQTGGVDANNDGIDDNVKLPDADNDNTPDVFDTDSDNDGIPDRVEGSADTDNDGIPNYLDTDSDNDGVSDAKEAGSTGTDTDNDGIDDRYDVDQTGGVDANNDGIDDEAAQNQDFLNTSNDTDGDGLSNALEKALGYNPEKADSDGDGIADGDEDIDGDGLSNAVEISLGLDPTKTDTDGDNISDGEEDYDNDGVNNLTEILVNLDPKKADTDGDGVNDTLVVDWDGDGINNIDEVGGSPLTDNDNDGVPVYLDDDDTNGKIKNANGRIEYPFDIDNDGILNSFDRDDDGDGILTIDEGMTDTDADGIPDYLESNTADYDGDGLKNFEDNDDDNDGIPTLTEVPVITDYNKDIDADGIPDFLDVDTTNVANMADSSGDSDGNGLSDIVDCNSAVLPCVDLDKNGSPDYLDKDDDNDGFSDLIEIGADSANPLDSDNDGFADYRESNIRDDDGDGIANYLDDDDDNDGTLNVDEGKGDADGDGIPDYLDPDTNSKNPKGNPNGDADGDGISDAIECATGIPCTDSNGDGIPDYQDKNMPIQQNPNNSGDSDGLVTSVTGGGAGVIGTTWYWLLLGALFLRKIIKRKVG